MAEKLTFGRRTWDREEYAELARKRKQGLLPTDVNSKKLKPTTSLDFTKDLNKLTVITSQVTRTRGKAFGFYCEVCDLTYKDNLKYVDHLNSKVHFYKLQERDGKDDGSANKTITLEDVKKRYDMLCLKLDQLQEKEMQSSGKADEFDVLKRIEQKKIEEQDKRDQGIRRAKEKEEKKKLQDDSDKLNNGLDENVMEMMGITGFGSTKK
ncbi:hypothetical protein WICPIJ_005968 [Wickerhamomyces pijperi]|uniref:C2H2-type domain-containing protein n=1 Tax=Wickerhamomyces pijperi TaxID=599730 RepID=A0A9P8TLF0_WICPI|nr:hypothetical protein WICPIJ_005968 [Wickerhamomyces pijperi]